MKTKAFVRTVFLLLTVAVLLSSCVVAPYVENELGHYGGVTYVVSKKKDICYATYCDISLRESEIVIDIPNKLPSGHKVEGIGGYNGRESKTLESYYSFHFNTDDYALEGAMGTAVPENAMIDEYNITVNIGKYVEYIQIDYGMGEGFQTMLYKISGANRYVRYNIHYNVDPENKNFYSENGILYAKEK